MNRKPAVAGAFYPANPKTLEKMVDEYLIPKKIPNLKGIIAPHAGFIYSGPTAGHAYGLLPNLPQKKYNVFVLAPSHYSFTTASVGNYEYYETPLGNVKVNGEICEELLEDKLIVFDRETHVREHSLEVQLPFLIRTIKNFELVPIVIGNLDPDYLAKLLQPYFEKEDSFFVISSDLSHFETYDVCKQIDKNSLEIISALNIKKENELDACGNMGIKVIMRLANQNSCKIELLDYKNSGDTAGDKDRVVGYGALAIIKT